ncbi:MAG: branched-chain amino acid ABC transporter ATP-binding protein/permease [Acetobacteraceae bacterium]|nr:branched-chain amino acid ABC transporter ATP-binding protein/permease [Acetobacteraceae bacterium]
MNRALPLAELGLAATLILAPFVLPHVAADIPMLSRILIWGFFGLGFSILFGFTGLLSLGQAVFFGAGGFVTAYLMIEQRWNVLLALLAGTVAAILLGLVIGYFTERRRGIYFAMITLAFGEMFSHLDLTTFAHYTGGENGLPGVPPPALFGWRADSELSMYSFIAVFFFVGYLIARRIVASPVGRILLAIRDNEGRVLATGNAVHLYKLCAFTVAAAYAGLAGGLLGMFQNYMPPDAFTFETSGQLLIQTVIGGASSLLGPLVGGAAWIYLRETLQHGFGLDTSWRLILGIVFVLLVSFLRQGIVGGVVRLFHRPPAPLDVDHDLTAAPNVLSPAARPASFGPPILQTEALGKRFGGLAANEDVNFAVAEFEVRGLIGPNGAGKSTFFRMLAGEMQPTSGRVLFRGKDVTGNGVCAMCQNGVAKSYQINQLFDRLSVRENLLIPTLAATRGRFRLDLLRSITADPAVERGVHDTLALVDLSHKADTPVNQLAYGEKRRLEIGLCLASNPKVLLLDEPLAGMSPSERVSTIQLLTRLREGRTMVIVEHDMEALFGFADRVTVLVEGKILVEGTPDEVRADKGVQTAYLGGVDHDLPAEAAA